MKHIFYFVWVLLLAGCASHDGYVVTGNVPEGWEGRDVQLVVADVNHPYVVDSTVISGGKFQFKGKFDLSRFCNVVIFLDPERQKHTLIYDCPLFLDSVAMQIDCDNSGKQPRFRVSGASAAQTKFQAYNDAYRNLQQQLANGAIFDQYRQAQYVDQDYEKAMELAQKASDNKARLRAFRLQYIKEHPDSPVSVYIARGLCEKQTALSREEIEQIWAAFPATLQRSEPGQNFREMMEQKKLFLGQSYPDMELMTADGGTKKISDYVIPGHYTLLEFWASWCNPCREEIPHMKRAYEKYHSKGFDIISVSIDKDPEAWKKAIAEENMPWEQLCDWNERQYLEKSVFKAYEGIGVPYSVMLDDQGNVIHLDARGGWLNILLREKFD